MHQKIHSLWYDLARLAQSLLAILHAGVVRPLRIENTAKSASMAQAQPQRPQGTGLKTSPLASRLLTRKPLTTSLRRIIELHEFPEKNSRMSQFF